MTDVSHTQRRPDGSSEPSRGAVRAALGSVVVLVLSLGLLVGLSLTDEPGPTSPATESVDASHVVEGAPLRSLPRRRTQDARALGDADAPVVLVVYSHYGCQACAYVGHDVLPVLEREYVTSGDLRIEWRDYPTGERSSRLAARAGWAAGEQGAFWEFHDELQTRARSLGGASWDVAALTEAAAAVGMDTGQFRRDLGSDRARQAVRRDVAEARRIGVTDAPVVVLGGKAYPGSVPLDQLRRAVAQARVGVVGP